MKRFYWIFGLLLAGCVNYESSEVHNIPHPPTGPEGFVGLRDAYLALWKQKHPLDSVALGYHEFDGKFVVPTADELARQRKDLHAFSSAVASYHFLTADQKFEQQLLEHWLATDLWTLETQRAPYVNPMFYANALDVSVYLKRDWKPWAERVVDMTACLSIAPQVLDAARKNLEPHLPAPFIETAVDVAEGTASFLQNEVSHEVQTVQDPAIRDRFYQVSSNAIAGLKDYAAWLKRERLPKATAAFALGTDRFAARLKAERIDLTPREVLKFGLRELHREQERFAQAAREIDPSKPAAQVFEAIQKDHPTAEGLIRDTRRDLEVIRQFVLDHKLVTVPSEVRATVRETLPPFRSTSFASMDTPGPFETKATEAYYYVTLVEAEWPETQKNEWLTAFNYYTTDVVSIHEAYPGHYVQFLAMNASGATPLAKIYNSYAFVEGWAHYTEQMVLDAGFAGAPVAGASADDQRVRAAKFRLAQSDEALLRLCRLCVALQMHCEGMTLAQGTQFFIANCYYAPKPAASEARRGTFDPGYCFYTLGKLQILKLRQDWQAQEGDRFSLQRFHDEVLSHGAPPIGLLRQQMLKDPALWPKIL